MKILIAADTYYPHVNGASYFAQRLAHYLHRCGHRVLVIAPSRKLCKEVYQHGGVQVLGVRSMPVFIYKNFRISPRPLQGKTIRNAVTTWAPDIVHVQGHFFLCKEVLKTARGTGVPTVGTNHFMPENLIHYSHLPAFAMEWLQEWGWKQFRSVFEEIDIVTTPTETAAQLLHQIGLRKEVIAISCGIDLGRFCPSAKIIDPALKCKYNIPGKRQLLLYVGRLDKEKHIDLVLRALSHVSHAIDVHCVIAGSGAEGSRLKRLTHELGLSESVTFTGFVPDDDLPGLYALADCFIIASTAELQSIVTMEAMASGLPIIAVRAMALPELVQDGINGYLFDPGDENGVAKSITRVFQDEALKVKMGEESLQRIKKHDINEITKQFERIYRQLADRYRKRGGSR